MTILTGVRSYIMVVLIYISLIISDIEASFHVPVVNCMSSLTNVFRYSAYFFDWVVFCCVELYELFVYFGD